MQYGAAETHTTEPPKADKRGARGRRTFGRQYRPHGTRAHAYLAFSASDIFFHSAPSILPCSGTVYFLPAALRGGREG